MPRRLSRGTTIQVFHTIHKGVFRASEYHACVYKSLGIHVTCEPHYEVKRFYHK